MAKKSVIEYGVKIAPVGLGEGVISKAEYFKALETEYPSADGWVVVDRHVTAQTDMRYLIAYHLERRVE
jgi:hypothetical protein